jgi:SAM-dependent methyltransferase
MARRGDAFGEALLDCLHGGSGAHVIERDDGLVEAFDSTQYFGGPDAHAEIERVGLDHLAGRVLDVGAGAGRFSLAAQDRGLDVTALDDSAGAIEVCRRRGVRRTVHRSIHLYEPGERFDGFLMMGHNLGLLAPDPVRSLERLAEMANPGAVVVGTTLDPYSTDEPTHLEYHRANRERGRMAGHVVLRVRTKNTIGPWFDYLFCSFDELTEIATRAGWVAERLANDEIRYLAALRLRS